jgi:hypothetical protein
VDGEYDNDIVRVKDAKGGVILTMSLHSAEWSKDRDNKALVYRPEWMRPQEDTTDWVTGDTHAGLTALLGTPLDDRMGVILGEIETILELTKAGGEGLTGKPEQGRVYMNLTVNRECRYMVQWGVQKKDTKVLTKEIGTFRAMLQRFAGVMTGDAMANNRRLVARYTQLLDDVASHVHTYERLDVTGDTHAGLTALLGRLRVKKHADVDTVDRMRKTVYVDVVGGRLISSTKHPPRGCDVVEFLR